MQHVALTEEEARQYYNTHQDEFMTPATVTLREILVAVPTTTTRRRARSFNAAADDAAKAEDRRRFATRDRKGEDFAKLVAEVSESATKANGGLIGPINVDGSESGAAATSSSKLKPGDITRADPHDGAATRSSSSTRAAPQRSSRSRRCATRSRSRFCESGWTSRRRSSSTKLRAPGASSSGRTTAARRCTRSALRRDARRKAEMKIGSVSTRAPRRARARWRA